MFEQWFDLFFKIGIFFVDVDVFYAIQIISYHPVISHYFFIRTKLCCKMQAELDLFAENLNAK